MKLLVSHLVLLVLVTTCYAYYGNRRLKMSMCPQSGLLPDPQSQCCGVDSLGSNRIVASSYPTPALIPYPKSQCCGVDTTDPITLRVAGGDEAKLRQYPWLVLIEYIYYWNGLTDTRCGGSLISGRYVLTAAHCVAGKIILESKPVRVRLGEHNRRTSDCVFIPNGEWDCPKGPESIDIENIITYEGYYHHSRDDIALIRLAQDAPYTDKIRPICLPTSDVTRYHAHNDFWFLAAGWGEQGTSGGSDVKRHVALPFMPFEECYRLWGNTVHRKHICAGGEMDKSICKGDSGGPLMFENGGVYEVIGITSFLEKDVQCGKSIKPPVFTKVYDYMDWILWNIKP